MRYFVITEMLVPGHVCSLYVATGGCNGPALGSDEKEIVLLDYSVIDVLTNEVSSIYSKMFFTHKRKLKKQQQQTQR